MWRSKRMPSVIGNQTRTSSTWSSGRTPAASLAASEPTAGTPGTDGGSGAAEPAAGMGCAPVIGADDPAGLAGSAARRPTARREIGPVSRSVSSIRAASSAATASSSTTLASWSSPGGGAAWKPGAQRPSGRRLLGASAGCGRRSGGSPRARSSRPAAPASSDTSGGFVDQQTGSRHAQRGANGQPTGAWRMSGGRPSIGISSSPSTASSRGIEWSSPTVYGCEGRANSSTVVAVSTMNPAYITLIRWVIPATTPRSWVIRMSAVPASVVRRWSSSRTCAWIVTSSAVVGSSAMSSFGSSASAIAIITRWRIPPENWCGKLLSRFSGRGIPTISRSSIARFRASTLDTFLWARIVSTICSSIVRTGLSEVIGSWKIIAMSRPRMSRTSSSRSSTMFWPSNMTRPPSIRPAGFGQQAHDRQVRHALAAAGLADEPEPLALLELEADPVDGVDRPLVGAELDDQVLDVQERWRSGRGCRAGGTLRGRYGGGHRLSRGSSDSRSPSPRRLKPIAVIEIAAPVQKMIHGAWR